MNDRARARVIRRILVALDASPHSLAALDAAAELAASLRAELMGLFVEDANLLRVAGYPFAREFGAYTAQAREIDPEHVERELRAHASLARQALSASAQRVQVRSSFAVRRGAVTSEILAAAMEADLLIIGRSGWSVPQRRALGSTARAVLTRAPGLALILEQGVRLGLPVVAVYDGSPLGQQALELAADLAQVRGGRLTVLVLAVEPERAEAVRNEARAWLEARDLEARFRPVMGSAAESLLRALAVESCGMAVMPAGLPALGDGELLAHLTEIGCPVLVVS
jgi:nucleotide-binding universal stress UspA family protein